MKPSKIGAAMALGLATMGLAACSQEAETTEEAPEGIAGMQVDDARMVLNAVSGNPAALYMDITYEGDRAIQVRRFDVLGADRTELHGYMEMVTGTEMVETSPFAIADGETVSLEPGGIHVMAFDVAETLSPGDTTEVTLTVAGGDKHSFPVEVRAAGEDR